MESRFEWSSKALTPFQIIEQYKERFPIIVQVKEGYSGDNSWESLSQSEIWRIRGCSSVKRAICVDKKKRCFSVPLNYKYGQFKVQDAPKETKGKLLSEVLSSHPPPRSIIWKNIDALSTEETTCSFTVTRIYNARYMFANRIKTESVDSHSVIIPSYAKGTMVVAKHSFAHSKYNVRISYHSPFESLCMSGILQYSSGTIRETLLENQTHIATQEEPSSIYESLEPETVFPHMYQPLSEEGLGIQDNMQKTPSVIQRYRIDGYHSDDKTQKSKENMDSIRPSPPIHIGKSRTLGHSTMRPPPLPQREPVPDYDHLEQNIDIPHTKASGLDVDQSTVWPANMDISQLSQADVMRCLKYLNMERYQQTFEKGQINGSLLVSLDMQTLIDDLGMSRLDAKKLVKFCRGWRPG